MPFGYPFAAPCGGGPDVIEVEYQALLAALDPGLNRDDPVNQAMAWAEAIVTANIWSVGRRVEGTMIPRRMMDSLPDFEEACALRPLPTDTDVDRRLAVEARLRGILGNSIAQVYDVLASLAGDRFLGIDPVPDDEIVTYWPGVNPGPPGFEWSSNRAQSTIRIRADGLASAALLDLFRRIRLELQVIMPGWNTFVIGTDEGGFLADAGLADTTLI